MRNVNLEESCVPPRPSELIHRFFIKLNSQVRFASSVVLLSLGSACRIINVTCVNCQLIRSELLDIFMDILIMFLNVATIELNHFKQTGCHD